MLYTIKVGIKTTSYCDVTIDAPDLDNAGDVVKSLYYNSPTFRDYLRRHGVTERTEYELMEGDNIGSKSPTFNDLVMEHMTREALMNYIRKSN